MMDIDKLKRFCDSPCMALREICENISNAEDDIVDIAYHVLRFVVAGKIRILHGDIEKVFSFVNKCADLYRKPISKKSFMIDDNGDSYTIDGYVDYHIKPGDKNYDTVFGVAHSQYIALHGDCVCGMGTETYLSPLDVFNELNKKCKIDDEIKTNSKTKYLKIIAMLLENHESSLPLEGRNSCGIWKRKLQTAGYPLDDKTIRKVLKEIKDVADKKKAGITGIPV